MRARRVQTLGRPKSILLPNGQNRYRPRIDISAGATVSAASSVIAIDNASAGPIVLNIPNWAIDVPKNAIMTVPAEAAITLPIRCMVPERATCGLFPCTSSLKRQTKIIQDRGLTGEVHFKPVRLACVDNLADIRYRLLAFAIKAGGREIDLHELGRTVITD